MTDPNQALDKLRALGVTEGDSVTDVRAGECEVTTLTARDVTLVGESGKPLDAGTAADFLEWCQNGSIRLGQ